MAWIFRIRSFMDPGTYPPVFWYLVHDGRADGAAYFVGYDSDAKLPIGYIGSGGFSERVPPPQQRFPIKAEMMVYGRGIAGQSYSFQEPCYYEGYLITGRLPDHFAVWDAYFVSEGRLLHADLHERTVRTVPETDGICSVARVQWAAAPGATKAQISAYFSRDYMAARTAERILVLDATGKQQQSFAVPDGWHDRRFEFYALRDDRAMLVFTHTDQRNSSVEYTFAWIDAAGNVTDEKSVTFENTSLLSRPDVSMAVGGLAVPAPGVLTTATAVVLPCISVYQGSFPSYRAAFEAMLPYSWPSLLAVNLLGVVLAILCYRRQKKFAQPRVWPWVAFVFLFGLPGMVGYLAHQRWPVREACPKCKRRVPRDREACAACNDPFPQPAMQGIEVLV